MTIPNPKQSVDPNNDIDVQLQADWEDIGGVGNNMTPEQPEHMDVSMFGCPPGIISETKEKPMGKTLLQVFDEAGMLDEDDCSGSCSV